MTSETHFSREAFDPDENYFNLAHEGSPNNQSNYFSIEEFNSAYTSDNVISCIQYNVRSFSKNMDYFLGTFRDLNSLPDILVLSETWFESDSKTSLPNFQASHTVRETGRSGGMGLDSGAFCLAYEQLRCHWAVAGF